MWGRTMFRMHRISYEFENGEKSPRCWLKVKNIIFSTVITTLAWVTNRSCCHGIFYNNKIKDYFCHNSLNIFSSTNSEYQIIIYNAKDQFRFWAKTHKSCVNTMSLDSASKGAKHSQLFSDCQEQLTSFIYLFFGIEGRLVFLIHVQR
jgi:hypothetical protein